MAFRLLSACAGVVLLLLVGLGSLVPSWAGTAETAEVSPGTASRISSIAAVVRYGFTADCAAAEQGDGAAAYRIARRYLFGAGVRRSKHAGVAWLRVAARAGHREARYALTLVPRAWGQRQPDCRHTGFHLGPVIRKPPEAIVHLVEKLAPDYRLDPALVLAVIQVESAFQVDAISPKQAMGLMQLIPGTADRFGVDNVFDPEDNIRGGMKYLRWLLDYFKGDVTLALAGYNAGEHAVDRYRGVPPYAETQGYVRLVHQIYPKTTHPAQIAAAAPGELPKPDRKPDTDAELSPDP
ncbi:MAG: transglycosylase SLT domain-containing protein [Azospirillum sp.]|nr:transglycosylase SLT domain-containing protein [Azospirillum sp.]